MHVLVAGAGARAGARCSRTRLADFCTKRLGQLSTAASRRGKMASPVLVGSRLPGQRLVQKAESDLGTSKRNALLVSTFAIVLN